MMEYLVIEFMNGDRFEKTVENVSCKKSIIFFKDGNNECIIPLQNVKKASVKNVERITI